MKRDLDLIRNILLHIESSNRASFSAKDFIQFCEDKNLLYYNIHLMYEAGFIEALEVPCCGIAIPQYRILWITNVGCDYMDSVRSDGVWNKIKPALRSVGDSVTFDIVKTVASKLITNQLDTLLHIG